MMENREYIHILLSSNSYLQNKLHKLLSSTNLLGLSSQVSLPLASTVLEMDSIDGLDISTDSQTSTHERINGLPNAKKNFLPGDFNHTSKNKQRVIDFTEGRGRMNFQAFKVPLSTQNQNSINMLFKKQKNVSTTSRNKQLLQESPSLKSTINNYGNTQDKIREEVNSESVERLITMKRKKVLRKRISLQSEVIKTELLKTFSASPKKDENSDQLI